MRALLLTVGSQGDVQPYVALAGRLRAAGHDVVLAAPAVYQGLANSQGLTGHQGLTGDPFVPLDLDMTTVGRAVDGKHGLRHMLAFTKAMGRHAPSILPQLTKLAREGADVVVHHPVLPLGQHLAELLRVPAVVASPLPALVPTREFLSPAWPATKLPLPKALNRPSYRAARYVTGAWCRRDVDRWRAADLGLDNSKKNGRHDPLGNDNGNVTVLHSFSEHVVPKPADWPATAHITGYWSMPETDWTPPRRLAEFLDAGQPPVYIGFGSMPVADPARLADAIVTATRETATRAVLFSLDPQLRRHLGQQRTVTVIRQAPHDWLFPRMSAVVHHGGAGTTGAAVRAGRPQVIWPFGIDQHFWAGRMEDLGVAVPAKPVRALSGTTLAAAIDRATTDAMMNDLAAGLANRIRTEDGTGVALAHLERVTTNLKTKVPA
jgi:sterol 3beta-glucosyltransferase